MMNSNTNNTTRNEEESQDENVGEDWVEVNADKTQKPQDVTADEDWEEVNGDTIPDRIQQPQGGTPSSTKSMSWDNLTLPTDYQLNQTFMPLASGDVSGEEVPKQEDEFKPHKEVNILLLGQTGVGKSTFINGFANYLNYPTLEEAEANDLLCPVASQFTITDEVTYEAKKIVIGVDDNESQAASQGQSATQNAKAHVFPFEDLQIRLIDTPGIGDTRGVEQDKENFKQILTYISNYEEIHGICILLKPNESRLDVMFRFCIQELLTHLHKSATSNMVFCFTNARNTNYKPGDTMIPLVQLLKNNGLSEDIKIRKDIVYCMDNESFRYLAAVKNDITFEAHDREMFAMSWKRSRMTSVAMVDFFRGLDPHQVKNTLSLNDTRRMIVEITKPLAEMTKHIQSQIDSIKDQSEEVLKHKGNIKDLEKKLHIRIKDIERMELGHPRTVCTSAKCTSQVGFRNVSKTQYDFHCHSKCYLDGVETDVVDNSDIRRCNIIDDDTGHCRECGCSWNTHMHVTYEMKEVDKEAIDTATKAQMDDKKDIVKTKERFIEEAKNKITEMKSEKALILKISARFGCFLKQNAITPYNDAMIAYINHQIKDEKDKINRNIGSEDKLEKLENTKVKYEQEIKIIENSMTEKNSIELTPTEIKKLQQELFKLPNFGANLKKMYDDIEKDRKLKTFPQVSFYGRQNSKGRKNSQSEKPRSTFSKLLSGIKSMME